MLIGIETPYRFTCGQDKNIGGFDLKAPGKAEGNARRTHLRKRRLGPIGLGVF